MPIGLLRTTKHHSTCTQFLLPLILSIRKRGGGGETAKEKRQLHCQGGKRGERSGEVEAAVGAVKKVKMAT